MLRIIIERHVADFNEGYERKDYFTYVADMPDVETLLRRGCRGEMGFDSWTVKGMELIDPTTEKE